MNCFEEMQHFIGRQRANKNPGEIVFLNEHLKDNPSKSRREDRYGIKKFVGWILHEERLSYWEAHLARTYRAEQYTLYCAHEYEKNFL